MGLRPKVARGPELPEAARCRMFPDRGLTMACCGIMSNAFKDSGSGEALYSRSPACEPRGIPLMAAATQRVIGRWAVIDLPGSDKPV